MVLMLVVAHGADLVLAQHGRASPIWSASALLLLVEFVGDIGMGAQRWIDLGLHPPAAVAS